MGYRYLFEDSTALVKNGNIHVVLLESYTPGMTYYHMHSHYEISMILSGDVSVLLHNQIVKGTEPKIIMLQPLTLHYMIPEPSQLYRRINISFTKEYVKKLSNDWSVFCKLFPQNGGILLPDDSQLHNLEQIFTIMMNESDHERNKYLLMYALSLLSDVRSTDETETVTIPKYVCEALSYYNEHFTEQITADELANQLGIGRTTLMTGFRRYTGNTIHQYQQNLRLKYAEHLRQNGATVGEAAAASGFCDIGGYIRAYKKVNGITPTGKK